MSTASSTFLRVVQTRRHYGLGAATHWLGSRLLEKVFRVEVNELLYLDASNLPFSVETDPQFTFRFLTPAEVLHFVQDPSLQLANEFIVRSASRHDLCLAALHGEQLASYSWYALNCVEGQHHMGVPMSYPKNFAYMYNAFTRPEYRGRRLYGIGIAMALKELAGQGVNQLITSINTCNFASVRSCRRLGFVNLGRIWTWGRATQRRAITPKAARKFGICFGNPSKQNLTNLNRG